MRKAGDGCIDNKMTLSGSGSDKKRPFGICKKKTASHEAVHTSHWLMHDRGQLCAIPLRA